MIVQFIFAVLSVVGFCLVFNVRGMIAFYASIVGGLGWIVYLIAESFNFNIGICFFLAGALVTLGSELIARHMKTPVTSSLIPAFTPLVPGGGAYYTMFYIFNGDYDKGLQKGVETFIISIAIILGFLVVADIFKLISRRKNKKRGIV